MPAFDLSMPRNVTSGEMTLHKFMGLSYFFEIEIDIFSIFHQNYSNM